MFDTTYSYTNAIDGSTSRAQYGVPQHMVNSIFTVRPVDGLLSVLSDFFWQPPATCLDPRCEAGRWTPVHPLDVVVATDSLANGRVRADLSIRNVLDTQYSDLVYRNDANAVNEDPVSGAVSAPKASRPRARRDGRGRSRLLSRLSV